MRGYYTLHPLPTMKLNLFSRNNFKIAVVTKDGDDFQ